MAVTITKPRNTLGGIRERVQSNLDESPGDESLWGPGELDEWIFQAQLEVYQLISMSFEGYFLKAFVADFTAGKALIELPDRFVRWRILERQFADGTVPLQRYERMEASNNTQLTGGVTGLIPGYRFFGNCIRIEPTPDTDLENALIGEYEDEPPPLEQDSDRVDPNFHQGAITLIILKATILAKAKEEGENAGTTGGMWVAEFNGKWQLYKEWLEQRHMGRDLVEPFGIEDNDGSGHSFY